MAEKRKIGSIFVDMILGQAQFDKDVQNFQKKMKSFGKDLTQVGKSLSLAFTAPLTAMGALAIKASASFETAFAGVAKTVNASAPQLDRLRSGLMDLAETLPVPIEQLAKFEQIGGQLNIAPDKLEKFAAVVAKVGMSFDDIAPEDAATRLAQIANATQTPIDELDRLASAVATVADTTAASEGPIIDMAQRLQAIALPANMSAAEIVGIAGGLADLGIEAELGGGAMQRLIVDMLKAAETGDGLKEWAAVTGVSMQDFSKAMKEDASGAVATFVERLGWIKDQGGSVVDVLDKMGIKETRMVQVLLSAAGAGDRFRTALETSKKAYEDNTRLTSESARVMATWDSQIKLAKGSWNNLFILIGDDLKQTLAPLVTKIAELGKWFGDLDPKTRKAAEAFGLMLASIGPILIIGGTLLTVFASPFLLWTSAIAVGLGLAAAAWVKWGDQFLAGIDRIVAAWDLFVTTFERGWQRLPDVINTAKDVVIDYCKQMFEGIQMWLVTKFDSIVASVQEKIDKITGFFSDMYESVVGHSDVPDMVDGIGEEMEKLHSKMVVPASNATEAVKKLMAELAGSSEKSNKKLAAAIAKSVEAIGALAKTETPVRRLAKELEALLTSGKQGQELADALTKIRDGYKGSTEQLKVFDEALDQASDTVTEQQERMADLGKEIDKLAGIDAFPEISRQIKEAFGQRNQQTAEQFRDRLVEIRDTLVHTTEEAEAFSDALNKTPDDKPGFIQKMEDLLTGNWSQQVSDDFADTLGESVMGSVANGIKAALTGGDLRAAFKDFGADVGGTLGGAVFGPIGEVLGEVLGDKIAGDLSQIGQSSKDTIQGISTAIDTIFPGVGSAIGAGLNSVFGGSQDAQSVGRDQIEQWLEGQLGTGFDFGSMDVAAPGWADEWWSMAEDNSVTAFTAIGEGLTEMLGITEDIGPQIGFILSQNLGGNLDEARLLMNELGISAADLEDIIIKQGIAAGKSWHEIEVMLQGVTALSGEGLVAVGDLEGAFGRLIISGGKGADAVVNLRNLAIEAMEAGATSLADLEARLRASGKFTDAEITALMTSLGQRGITSLEQLGDASVRILGGVVADMLTQLGENFGESVDRVNELIDAIDSIPRDITTVHHFETEGDPGGGGGETHAARGAAFAFARGGIVKSKSVFSFARGAQMGVMGEAGPEAILPLTRSGGKLGVNATGFGGNVSQDLYITVNAPNAAPGMEHVIQQTMQQMVDHATAKTLRVIYESARR